MKKLFIIVAVCLVLALTVVAIGRVTFAKRGWGITPIKLSRGARLNPVTVVLTSKNYATIPQQFGNALDSVFFWTAPRDGYVEDFYISFSDSTLDIDTLAAQCDSFFIVKFSGSTATNIGARRTALKANAYYPRIPWFVTGTDTNKSRYVSRGDSLVLRIVGVSAPDSILAPITIRFQYGYGDNE